MAQKLSWEQAEERAVEQWSRLSCSRWAAWLAQSVGIIWAANVPGGCVVVCGWEVMWGKERGLNLGI